MIRIGLLFPLCFIPAILIAQTPRLDTLRHFDPRPQAKYSAIWGYTAPNGREYALLGVQGVSGQGGASIIDISDGSSVREVAFIPGPSSLWHEMKTYRNYAYIVSEGGGGVQIVDLSQLPVAATLVRTFTYISGQINTSRSHTISIHGGFMYLTSGGGGLISIFNLRPDPLNPQYVGQYTTNGIFHDCYVLRDTIYASAIGGSTGLWIADARNKANIRTIARIAYANAMTHNAWVTRDRRYVITTDESSITPTLKVWNIANLPAIPTAPTATFSSAPADIEHNITIRGNYAYVAWFTAGVRVVDITNPAAPADAGGYRTSTFPPGRFNGVWGVYPYFPSGKIIGGDTDNGLWVFRFSRLASRAPVSLLQPPNRSTLVTQQPITFRWTRTANPTDDPHSYTIRIYGPLYDSTFAVSDTLFVLTAVAGLQGGATYNWRVTSIDEFNETASQDSFQFKSLILPVQLVSFTGAVLGGGRVRLDWRTLSEINNYGFEVQRSPLAPLNFSTLPNSFIPGHGTTNVPHQYSFVDTSAIPARWHYRLKQIDLDGTTSFTEPIQISVPTDVTTGTAVKPQRFTLEQNYPNPFNPSTKIRLHVPDRDHVTLRVFDLLGREVATLINEQLNTGDYEIIFNAENMTAGVYFYQLKAESFVETKKLILVR